MPALSKRGYSIPFSPFRKLIPFADEAKANGKQVFHLNIGQPDIETPHYALQAVRGHEDRVVSYTPAVGQLSLRKKMAVYYQKFGIFVDPEQMIITNGGSEALNFLFQSCLNPGDEVIAPEPFYANYVGYAHSTDVHIRPLTSYIENGFQLPSIEAFEATITPQTKAILITNPNNPTGALYNKSDLEELAAIAKKYDLFLFADEVYKEFCFDDQSFFSVLSLAGMDDHVVVVDSISKSFSACGARIGSIVTRNADLLNSFTRLAKLRLSPSYYGQLLAEAILGREEPYLTRVKDEYDKRRKVVFNRLKKMPGVTTYLPGGAFYCFAKFPIDDCNRFCQWLLDSFDYQDKTLMLAMGDAFYATPGLGKDEVRIAFVLNSDDLEQAMDCLEEALKVYPGRTKPTEKVLEKVS